MAPRLNAKKQKIGVNCIVNLIFIYQKIIMKKKIRQVTIVGNSFKYYISCVLNTNNK